MEFNHRQEFNYPVDKVFYAFRDRVKEYAEHCPNIMSVNIRKREQMSETVLHQHCEWQGGGDIPELARRVVKPDMIRWDGLQYWDSSSHSNRFEIRPHYFADNVHCQGTWEFDALSKERCVGVVNVRFKFTITKLALPRFVTDGIAKSIEGFIGKQLGPNMQTTFDAINTYLASTSGRTDLNGNAIGKS